MIILDTNILSEPSEPQPNAAVIAFMEALGESAFTTAISIGEMAFGVERLHEGKRKSDLRQFYDVTLAAFEGRILPFDRAAAGAFGVLLARSRRVGRAVSVPDAQIAAIAIVRRGAVASRDDVFEKLEVPFINPWTQT